jgi:spermidine synthase
MLWLCFTLSGAAALALEALWMRSAGLVLGQTAVTTATVLACYFAGLGLGSAAARGIRDRPVRLYAFLEFAAAVGAVWSLVMFYALSRDGAQGWLAAVGTAGRVGAIAVAILPATLCFGATLPAVGQALADAESVGRGGGLLYAVNTLGGVLGLAAAGFGLPALIGVTASYGAAAGGSLVAGVLALAVSGFDAHELPLDTAPEKMGPTRGEREDASEVVHMQPFTPSSRPVLAAYRGALVPHAHLRIVAAGAGALGLGLEVLWTRLFAQVLHNSVYSFTAVALVFLLALAAGAGAAALLLRRFAPARIAAAALVVAAAATVVGVWTFVHATDGLAYVGMQSGLSEYLRRIIVLAAASVGPVAFASGMVLPALWAAWDEREAAARPLGDLSAANTFGGIAGAIAAGFLGVPLLGIRATLLAAAVVYVILADVIAPPYARLRPLAYAALLGIVLVNPMRMPLVHLRPEGETLRATLEGPSGIVTVVEADGDLQLRLDNYYVLGGTAAAANERRLGLVPLLLHPHPRRAAFIGLATGITASAGPAVGLEDTTIVELVPEVATAARTHFAPWNAALLERPDVNLVLDDGRRYLAATREHFDVIVSDLFIPWHAGAGSLYSREMYAVAAGRLAPGGIFCQWLPLYQLTREEFDMITHTFLSVFPQTSLWRADFYPDRPVVGLIGQLGSRRVDLEQVGERLGRLPDWSRDPLLATPHGFGMLYAGDLAAATDIFQEARVNTDDRPLLEFMAPRLTRINAAGDKDWFTGEALAAFYDGLDRRLADDSNPLFAVSGEAQAAHRAGTALYHYALAATRHDDSAAGRLEAEVRALVPEVIAGAESTDAVASLADARLALVGLRTEQETVRRQLEAMERRLEALTRAEKDHQ